MEDVTDIILNVKSLVVKLDADEPKEMKLVAKKAGADHRRHDRSRPGDHVINKDMVIATLTEDVHVRHDADGRQGPRLRHRRRKTSATRKSRKSA